jgi:hypothetical protein
MFKVAVLVWIMLGTVLAGAAMVAVMSFPGLSGQEMKMIPFAALAGFLIALPLSYLVARKIGGSVVQ